MALTNMLIIGDNQELNWEINHIFQGLIRRKCDPGYKSADFEAFIPLKY